MINSIQYLFENTIPKLEEIQINFFKHPAEFSSLIQATQDVLLSFAHLFFQETLEACDEAIRMSDIRKASYNIVRKDTKTLITTLGSFSFQKTLFQDKTTKKCSYLLDQFLELAPYTRITKDLSSSLVSSVATSSYQETAHKICMGDCLSKQTVKNKVHSLSFEPSLFQDKKKEKKI